MNNKWNETHRHSNISWGISLYITILRVQFSSVAQSCPIFVTPWTAARQASLSITNSWSPPKLMTIESVMPSNCLIPCRSLLLLPSIFPSIRVFSNESALGIRWPKYWNFSFNISPSNEHSGLISFRMDWLDLLAVQGALKSLRNIKKEVYLYSDFGWLCSTLLLNCSDCLIALTLAIVIASFWVASFVLIVLHNCRSDNQGTWGYHKSRGQVCMKFRWPI